MSDQGTTTRIEAHPAPRSDTEADARAARERRGDRTFDDAQRLLGSFWDAAVRMVRQGNRRRVTLRSRDGEVWARMPLTLAVVVALLLAPAWPLLLVLVAVGFAVGAQLSVERHAPAAAAGAPQT